MGLTTPPGLIPLATGVSGNLPLANGGTGASLADPNADRIMFWDDSVGAVTWLTVGSNLSITGDTISATAGGTSLNNLISTPTTIAADTSYPIVSYLNVSSDLTVSGNLMVTG